MLNTAIVAAPKQVFYDRPCRDGDVLALVMPPSSRSDTLRHVALLTPHFPPETSAGAQRNGAFAAALRHAGWRVSVVTLAPHHPQNRVYDGYDHPSTTRTSEDGMTVLRLRPFIVPKDRLVLRLLSETLFSIKAAFLLLRLRPDVVMASSPYMFLGPAGRIAAWLMGRPFVWDVRDLTWQYPAAAGKRTFGVDRILAALMRWTAARASALVATTQGQLDYFHRRPVPTAVIPNGVSDAWLDQLLTIGPPSPEAAPTVVYAGLMGYMHGLDTLVQAAAALPEVRFLFVGDGPEAPGLRELSTSLGLQNVEFWGHVPLERLIEAYERASVLVSQVRASPVFHLTQSAKVWEYLATGRPVLHAGEGESVASLQAGDYGATVAPGDAEALVASLRRLLAQPQESAAMAARGRAFVADQRRRSVLNRRLVELLTQIVDHSVDR